jgi:hypothetical protein
MAVLKRLHEVMRTERPERWPKYWILHRDSVPLHKALFAKKFLAQKSITEKQHAPYYTD